MQHAAVAGAQRGALIGGLANGVNAVNFGMTAPATYTSAATVLAN